MPDVYFWLPYTCVGPAYTTQTHLIAHEQNWGWRDVLSEG